MRRLLYIMLLCLTGCGSGAVVSAPTPLPPDVSPLRYEHPSGAFSLVVPRTWPVYEQNTTTLASTTFSMPGTTQPLLTVAVMNLGRTLEPAAFGDLITQYQTNIRADIGRYTEQNRQAMGDGSWRITGLRSLIGGNTQPINTFVEQEAGFIAVLDALVPPDPDQLLRFQDILNTFQINPQAELQPAELSVLVATASAELDVLRVSTWTTPAGVFYITGEVGNYGSLPAVNLPVQAVLYTTDGLPVAEAVDMPMGYAVLPGEFMPFSLRFGQGQPSLSTTYEITLGSPDWQAESDLVINEQDALTWTDESHYNEQGELTVSGTVTNTSAGTLRNLRAVVTLFGADQTVIGARFIDLTGVELAAGESAPFEIAVPEIGGDPAEYIVTIQAVP